MKGTCHLPNGKETTDEQDDFGMDIDRWENDGGRSTETKIQV